MNTTPSESAATMAPGAVERLARADARFDRRVADALNMLHRAAQEFPEAIVQATSLGAEDMVLTDLIARHALPIRVATLDTGMLHAETLVLRERVERHYDIGIEVWRPDPDRVREFVTAQGADAMYRSVALRHACCALRKLEPLERMLRNRRAWLTGLRREQSSQRATILPRQDDGQGRIKISPLLDWTQGDVWHYIALHGVPYNPLHDRFYPSIGCAPCTRAVAPGEDLRAGRWWWERECLKECGMHVQPIAAVAERKPTSFPESRP